MLQAALRVSVQHQVSRTFRSCNSHVWYLLRKLSGPFDGTNRILSSIQVSDFTTCVFWKPRPVAEHVKIVGYKPVEAAIGDHFDTRANLVMRVLNREAFAIDWTARIGPLNDAFSTFGRSKILRSIGHNESQNRR